MMTVINNFALKRGMVVDESSFTHTNPLDYYYLVKPRVLAFAGKLKNPELITQEVVFFTLFSLPFFLNLFFKNCLLLLVKHGNLKKFGIYADFVFFGL